MKPWKKFTEEQEEQKVIQTKPNKKKGWKKLLKNIVTAIMVVVFSATIFLTLYIIKDLPSAYKIKDFQQNLTTRIYSKDGVLLNNYASENRIFIPISEIPEHVIDAFLSAEDSNFYSHSGVDFIGILKASYKNFIYLATKKGQLVGASTITQQVVKNIFLTNEKTISRKVKEIIIALQISRHLSKNEVLELYLNYIYFGSSAYGVYSASEEYFGKNIKDITVEEAALLAALPKAPSDINPRKNPERALSRRNWVLLQMYKNNYISEEQLTEFSILPLDIVDKDKNIKADPAGINAFSDHVKSQISEMYGSNAIFSQGFFVQSTMDYDVQKAFYTSLRNGILAYDRKMGFRGPTGHIDINEDACRNLKNFINNAEYIDEVLKYGVVVGFEQDDLKILTTNCEEGTINAKSLASLKQSASNFAEGDVIVYIDKGNFLQLSQMPDVNAGLIVMDSSTGAVLSMIGDFYNRHNAFNRVTQAKRQLGSAVKPFIYLTALENGFSINSILVDEELKLSDEWQPRNASRDFLGSITLRTAFERSRNVPTVRVAEILGINRIINRLEEIQIHAEPIEKDLTAVLGSLSVTVEKVAEGFSIFTNRGKKLKAQYIEKIQDSTGKTIYVKDKDCNNNCFDINHIPLDVNPEYGVKIADEDVAFQVLSMLEGVVKRGTGRRISTVSMFGLGGKTGTSSNYKESWFVAITNKLIIVLYVGKDNSTSLGESQYGSVLALPIVRNGLRNIIHKYPISEFEPPESVQEVIIDYHTGELPTQKTTEYIVEYFKEGDKIPTKQNFNKNLIETENIEDINITNEIY